MQQVVERYITNELENVFVPFFNNKPTSLLIRGLPGAGKTTLALELLRLVKDRYKPLYISTRVSLMKLQIQFPWLKDLIQDDDIFSSAEIGNKSEAVDMRLSTAKGTMESVMNALTDSKNRFIILDSWDALAKEAPFEERIKMEKTMVTMADANEGFLLFISEEPEKNTLAYVTDAVLSLTIDEKQGFVIRKMIIDKMRTMPIKHKTKLYTLTDSHFVLLPSAQKFSLSKVHFNNNLTEISTGNRSLDNAIGGLKKGSIVLVETSTNINRLYLAIVLAPLIINNIKNKRLAFIISAPDKPYKSISRYVEPFCNEDELKHLTIFTFIRQDTFPKIPKVFLFEEFNFAKNIATTFTNLYVESLLNKEVRHPIITSYDIGLREMWAPNDVNELIGVLNNLIRLIRENDDILILISKPKLKTLQYAKNICDVYIKLWEENNVPMMMIRRPKPGIYSLLYNEHGDDNYYKLVEMM